MVSKKECDRLLKEVDKDNSGEVDYREFCKTMIDEAYEKDHDSVDKSSMLRQYASALRDNIGSSMQVKSNSGHLKMGAVNVGSGHNSMQMYQRDVGDRMHEMDLINFGSGVGAATYGPSVVHTTDGKGLSLLESALRTPRYTKMNEELACIRVASPGMNGVIRNSIYGDQDRVDLLLDPYGLHTKSEPFTSGRGVRDGMFKPCKSRSELFNKRRGENYKSLDAGPKHENFYGDAKMGKVFHFIKDRPNEGNRRMGDLRFDPDTGLDRVKYEKDMLASRAKKKMREAQRRYREALKGRGT